MFEYFHIFYRRLYNAVYCFFDKLSMRTKPSYDNFLDEEFPKKSSHTTLELEQLMDCEKHLGFCN
jgi:hypothetical protein